MNPSTALARAVLDELVHQGVREIVLAPGSRSAPLAFAALRLAEADRVRLHVRVDERSAGFLALGLAKVSGDPVAVLCTSGSAVANLAPAVAEASYSAVPLVAVTADRPIESRGVAAPQTIDQVGFFGELVRFATDLGAPRHPDPDDPGGPQRAARAAVGQAIAAAVGACVPRGAAALTNSGLARLAHAGPVHLNVAFRLPLVPDPEEPPAAGSVALAGSSPASAHLTSELAASASSGHRDRPPRPRRPPFTGCVTEEIGALLGDVPARGVLLVGDLPCSQLHEHQQWLAELATACGWPIVAEPSANLQGAATALGHGVVVLGSEEFLATHEPDLVVTAGLFGLSRPTMELLRRARRHVAIELPSVGREVCDPVRTAGTVLSGIPLPPSEPNPDPEWLAAWRDADAVAADVVADQIARPGGVPMTASAVVARLWAGVPRDALLLVAASWPVRLLEAVGGRRNGPVVIGNRGTNGIDGLVSTAWGAALAHQRAGDPTRDGRARSGPAFALLGDLAFLHDHNGLLVGADEPRPDLVLVVLDNDGGGIFHQLEQGRPEHAAAFERLFGTPLGRDLVAVAEAAGVPAVRVHDVRGLDRAVTEAVAEGGVRVVVAHVPDRAGEAALLDRIRRAAAGRIFATLP